MSKPSKSPRRGPTHPIKQRQDELRKRHFFVSLPLQCRLLILEDSCAEWGWPDTLGTIQGAKPWEHMSCVTFLMSCFSCLFFFEKEVKLVVGGLLSSWLTLSSLFMISSRITLIQIIQFWSFHTMLHRPCYSQQPLKPPRTGWEEVK